MKKIGIFLDEIKDQGIETDEKFKKVAMNTGNMLFWHSLKANLDLDVKSWWYAKHPEELHLDEYSAFVTTDLIWIRQMVDFSYLNGVLDVIGDLPLIPISIGLQARYYDPDFKFHPETVKVLKRISERCIMGVRGHYTAEILKKHGIGNFEVIGCPSMYMPGVDYQKINNAPRKLEKVTVNFETFFGKFDKPRMDFLKYCAEHNFSFAEQTQAGLSGKNISDSEELSKIKGWVDAQGNCFFDIGQWRDYMHRFDFSMGARFHGNVMALWEGVPALFFTCDSRTKELCEFYSLPHIDIEKFDSSMPVEYYYGLADYRKFDKDYNEKKDAFLKFLMDNRIWNSGEDKLERLHDKMEKSIAIEKNILYHCFTAYQFLEIVIHKALFHKNDRCTIIVSETTENLVPQIEDFKSAGFFDRIIKCNISYGFQGNKEEMQKNILEYFDAIFKENSMNIDDFVEIIIAGAYANFGVYSVLKGKNFSIFEDASGTLSLDNQYEWDKQNNETQAGLVNELGLYFAECENIDYVYCVINMQNIDKINNIRQKIKNFEVKDQFSKLPSEMQSKILKLYGVDSNLGDITVVFTQWFIVNNSFCIDKKLILEYQYLCDFFAPDDKILIKKHPADVLDYSGHFNRCLMAQTKYPSELLRFANNNIKKVISLSSTANNSFPEAVNICLNIPPFSLLDIYNKLLVINEILLKLFDYKLFCYGIDGDILKSFFKCLSGKEYNIQWRMPMQMQTIDKSVLIIDALHWGKGTDKAELPEIIKNLPLDTIFVFLNCDNAESFWDIKLNQLTKYALPLIIQKIRIKPETIYDNYFDEYIWIFSKNHETLEIIKEVHFEKNLYQVGIKIKSDITDDVICKKIEDAKLNAISERLADRE